MMEHKLLHDTTLIKVNVLDAQHITVESRHCVTRTTIVNCFQKCGFNFKQTDNGEDTTELSIAEDGCGQLQAGYHFKNMYPVIMMM
jgi:hypothetical protein